MMKILFTLFIFLIHFSIYSQETKKLVTIGDFLPYKSPNFVNTNDLIHEELKKSLSEKGFEIEFLNGSRKENLETSKEKKAIYYVEGFYKISEDTKSF
ncbi:MAG: hypothetical protein KDK36_06600, partial [Leptospiraceae bacterium]|nr:hypothetical protein [Leptospiraceae bacterium]